VIAGGHTLLPVMKQRLASPPHLVDLSHIEGLDGIEMKGRSLVIGATATHNAVATSPIVGEAIPALAELAGLIGDPAVRHKGTIGGSLANNDPTADYPAACLALGATIVTNKRRLKPEEFFQGLFTTALESDEPGHPAHASSETWLLSGNAETRRHRSNSTAADALSPSLPLCCTRRRLCWWKQWRCSESGGEGLLGCSSSCLDSYAIAPSPPFGEKARVTQWGSFSRRGVHHSTFPPFFSIHQV
jgi:hypothetical protein